MSQIPSSSRNPAESLSPESARIPDRAQIPDSVDRTENSGSADRAENSGSAGRAEISGGATPAIPPARMQFSPAVIIGWSLTVGVGILFLVLAQEPYYQQLNYTFVIADAFLNGQLGLAEGPSWLNELVPGDGLHYSVFPLGAVLSVLPFSLLVKTHILTEYPVSLVVGMLAGACAGLSYWYTYARSDLTQTKRVLLALWLVAGTWFATNLLFSGAWQISLGFAVLGLLAALVLTSVRPLPWVAGVAFALAFGNRTELLLLAPIVAWMLVRPDVAQARGTGEWRPVVRKLAEFSTVPLVLGLATLWYNQTRFGSVVDFGYARIPGVLEEPLYRDGIFSFTPVVENARQMLWEGWKALPGWPYSVPGGFGGSILLASPFLLVLVRRWRGDRVTYGVAALAILIVVGVLWLHGNPGGWQYSYRYALVLLPWFLVLFVELLPARIRPLEAGLWILSVGVSSYATFLFLWTDFDQP